MPRAPIQPRLMAALLFVAFIALAWGSLIVGTTGDLPVGDVVRGLLASIGIGEELEGGAQPILILRLRRTLVALGVGASLAYSGALLQGLFRNALASPSILGISTGASLGASLAIIVVGGYGPSMVVERAAEVAPALVTIFAFIGAFATTLLVSSLASRGGRLSVPTLLLAGIAVNACIGGLLTAIQSIALADNLEVAKALISWTFGSLTDHALSRVVLVWAGLSVSLIALPFVTRELDLFAGGEEDAEALGVNTARVKLTTLAAAALAAASAVAVAGQIAFVGLIVPHVVRMLCGTSHRHLLPLSLLGGAVLLLGADLGQRVLLGGGELRRAAMPPGVLMSLIGGPFFLILLMRSRRELQTW